MMISLCALMALVVIVWWMKDTEQKEKKKLKTFTENDYNVPHHKVTYEQASVDTKSIVIYGAEKCNHDSHHYGNCQYCEPLNLKNEQEKQIQELYSTEE